MRRILASAAVAFFAALASGDDEKSAAPPPPKTDPDLKIEVVKPGSGRAVKDGDDVLVQLVVSLADTGKELMNTRLEAEPQILHVGASWATPALDMVLRQMTQGEHVKATAPYRLAWGDRGYPGAAPPKTDVVLDLELVGFLDMPVEVLKSGSGPPPIPSNYVLIHVVGTLPDGTVEEDSRKDDAPLLVVLGAGKLPRAWETTLRGMRVGDRWKIRAPWQFAYGSKGTKTVPPKTDVVFDIERLPLPEFKIDAVEAGKGPPVRPGQQVTLHFTSTFGDKTFDDTRATGKPLAFTPGTQQVLPALELLVTRMRVGDRWKVVVPWQIGYGAKGRGPVPGKTDVVFDLELLDAR